MCLPIPKMIRKFISRAMKGTIKKLEQALVIINDVTETKKQISSENEMSIEEYTRPSKAKSKKKQIQPISTFDLEYHLETLKQILQFRGMNTAPVDIEGCQRLHDKKERPEIQKFQILISLLLSVQTKDQTTGATVRSLRASKLLTPKAIIEAPIEKLQQLIRKTNYHKKKAQNMKLISQRFLKNGPPKTYEQLMDYPGVGVKIATLYFNHAENMNQGVGVDTHVHRISNRLGWCQTKLPAETQQKLCSLFPAKYWPDINLALVGFGQTVCEAKKPRCAECPVRDRCAFWKKQ